MATTSRLAAVALAVVALGLTATGVVVAATDTSNPGSGGTDPLALNGYPPKTATLAFTADTGTGSAVTGTAGVDFATGEITAQMQIPLAFSSLNANLLVTAHHVYLGVGNLASVFGAPWVSVSAPPLNLYGISLEMTKPDIPLISAYDSRTVVTANGVTTYTFHWSHSRYHAPAGFPVSVPVGSAVTLSLSVGSQGELTGGSVTTRTSTSRMTITMKVVGYNQPVRVSPPSASQVRPITGSQLQKILGGLSLPSLGVPTPGAGNAGSGSFGVTSPLRLS